MGDCENEMLLCDKYDSGSHMYFLHPIVARVPAGSWFFQNCKADCNCPKHTHIPPWVEKKEKVFYESNCFEEKEMDIALHTEQGSH